MPIKRVLRRRVIRHANGQAMNRLSIPDPEYSSGTKKIMAHPLYDRIVKALHESVPVPAIAEWMDREDMLQGVTINTFMQYLYAFKRERPDTFNRVQEFTAQDEPTLEAAVGIGNPKLDNISEIDKLIRVQKRRLAIDLKNEVNINKLFNTTNKEVEVLGKLLELKDKIENNRPDAQVIAGTSSQLRAVMVDQGERDNMSSLVSRLMEVANNADPDRKKKKATG